MHRMHTQRELHCIGSVHRHVEKAERKEKVARIKKKTLEIRGILSRHG